MNGESGTSKTGAIHNYYTCYTRKRKHACDKKPLKKDWIEYIVAQDAMELLTDDTIQELADMAISQTEQDLRENTRIPELTDRMKETESGITNITKAIEKGIASDALMNRLVELEKEKKNLLRLLAEEEKYVCKIERSQIVYWLTEFKGGRIEDERYRRIIIDLMINSVTVWDEPDGFRITTAYNLTSCKSKTFRIAPSGEKGFGFEGSESTRKRPEILGFQASFAISISYLFENLDLVDILVDMGLGFSSALRLIQIELVFRHLGHEFIFQFAGLGGLDVISFADRAEMGEVCPVLPIQRGDPTLCCAMYLHLPKIRTIQFRHSENASLLIF